MTNHRSVLTWIDGQAFAHYEHWECRLSAFWDGGTCKHDRHGLSGDVLVSSVFMQSMRTLALIWPVSCAIHLTNAGINRRAWLGQSACFIETGNCISCTVQAWMELSDSNQRAANELANHFIAIWNHTNSRRGRYPARKGQLELAF